MTPPVNVYYSSIGSPSPYSAFIEEQVVHVPDSPVGELKTTVKWDAATGQITYLQGPTGAEQRVYHDALRRLKAAHAVDPRSSQEWSGIDLLRQNGCNTDVLSTASEIPTECRKKPDALYFANNIEEVAPGRGTCAWVAYNDGGEMVSQVIRTGCSACVYENGEGHTSRGIPNWQIQELASRWAGNSPL